MTRAAAVLLYLVIAIAVALLLLGLWQWWLGGDLGAGFAEAARLLFLFMDIGLGVWLVLLIVGAVRGWGRRRVFAAAAVGVVLNLATVLVVGFVQQGAVAWAFLFFAVTAGLAFLVGAAVAGMIVPRVVNPAERAEPRT